MMSGSPGAVSKFRRPVLVGGLSYNSVESLGSTGSATDDWQPTLITATAANMVFSLPNPKPGRVKWITANYTGNADDFIIACAATSQGFDGSTHNIITVSSSQEHASFLFMGLSTAQWGVLQSEGRALRASTAIATQDFAFSASTIKSTTDVT